VKLVACFDFGEPLGHPLPLSWESAADKSLESKTAQEEAVKWDIASLANIFGSRSPALALSITRFAKISRVDEACPSAPRGLPDFLTVSQAASRAEARRDVVSGSNEPAPKSEMIVIAVSLINSRRNPVPCLRENIPSVRYMTESGSLFAPNGSFNSA
jgi:hypothetical protein